jgi:hypothetical protein
MDVGIYETSVLINNYVENCDTAFRVSDASGSIEWFAGNRWYNCTTGLSGTIEGFSTDNSALSASGFVNASGGDFNLAGELLKQNLGQPSQYLGLSNHNINAGIGGNLPYVPYYPRLRQS